MQAAGRLTMLLHGFLERRFAWLFVALLLSIGIQPVVKAIAPRVNIVGWVLAASMLAAIFSAAREPWFKVLIGLGVAFAVLLGLRAAFGGDTIRVAGEAVWVTASLLASTALARRAFRAGDVDGERIFAALDAYLMAGLMFGVCFLALEQKWPNSFGAPAAHDLDLSSAVYFSFVTIATLGYGDVTPASDAARGLAVLEAVAGQFYIAVLVARLVGLYTVGADRAAQGTQVASREPGSAADSPDRGRDTGS